MKIKCWGWNEKRESWQISYRHYAFAKGRNFVWLDPDFKWQAEYVIDGDPEPQFELIAWKDDFAVVVESDLKYTVFKGRGAINRALSEFR